MKRLLLLLFINYSLACYGQTLGGNAVFSFLNFSPTPQLTGLGGINVSHQSNDIGLAFNNPALLRKDMHTQLQAVFHRFYAGINQYNLAMGFHSEKLNTNFGWGMTYLDYGTTTETDASGNILGSFRPVDWVVELMASRKYMEKWYYGGSLKYIQSDYGQFNSNGLAIDIGVLYEDTTRKLAASVLVKNLGYQLTAYPGTEKDDLPFDLQAGITKKLANAPFSFSLTAHHLHQFSISDLVIAGTVYIGDKLEFNAGYNFSKRESLKVGNADGLAGFSFAAGLVLEKLQVRYAKSWYQNTTGGNQLGINMTLNKYFGLGKFGQRIGW